MKMNYKEKKAISLIVLVITIIVLSILAATVIISLSNTNIISQASESVFKSDMSSYKEKYETYVISKIVDDKSFVRKSFSLTSEDDEFTDIFGAVPDNYKAGLKVIGGNLVYQSTDVTENKVLESLGMKAPEIISKETSYVGYFADVDGDENVDGVIYADLCKGGSGSWGGLGYTVPTVEADTVKEYYISEASYSVAGATGYGEHPVLTSFGNGEDRFYVMALDDVSDAALYWYKNFTASGTGEMLTTTFGSGEDNTAYMLDHWSNGHFGERDDLDMWGITKGCWFVPSRDEWSAFAVAFNLSLNTYTNLGLTSIWYWVSSASESSAYYVSLDGGTGFGSMTFDNLAKVRLSKKF